MKTVLKTPGDFRDRPWKNGLGVTREMYIHPEGASLEKGDFLWRLSSSGISEDGPFSSFPGYDRALFLLSGDGMDLSVDGRVFSLTVPFSSIRFRGEDETTCTLRNGSVMDFNIICARDAISCEYRKIQPVLKRERLFLLGHWTALLLFRGTASVEGEEKTDLEEMDLLVLEDYPPEFPLRLSTSQNTELLFITLTKRD